MITIPAISSKSYVHRLLIASALCGSEVNIKSNIDSKDMQATRRCLDALMNAQGKKVILDCGESGSTARFLLPLASLFADVATLTGSGKLPQRPMGPLCDVLREAGVSVSADHLPVTVSKSPHAGDYAIAGNVSSQFISGLLFMLPLLPGRSHLAIEGGLESAPYVDMTIDVLTMFGITIEKCADGYDIPGGQKYSCDPGRCDINNGKAEITAEGDWSNAAYIMAIASLGSGRAFDAVRIDGLNPDSIQGDAAIVDILEKFGINVGRTAGDAATTAGYVIKGRPVNAVDIDCTQIPDLVPALAVLAAFSGKDSVFRNVGRLRVKECDRIEAVTQMLGAVGVLVDITTDNGSENMIVHGIWPGSAADDPGPVRQGASRSDSPRPLSNGFAPAELALCHPCSHPRA